MKFYSGFSLLNDKEFFKDYMQESNLDIYGFSYGAIAAFEQAYQSVVCEAKRVDRVVLFSPAFFQNKPQSFKRVQLQGFAKNPSKYKKKFLQSCFFPCEALSMEHNQDGKEELEELLFYEWSEAKLEQLKDKGVIVEVYLGEKDAIIDTGEAFEFFVAFAEVHLIKDANHFLQKCSLE